MSGFLELVVFGGLVCWIFNESLRAMVDVLSTRLHNYYTKWEKKDPPTKQLSSPGLHQMVRQRSFQMRKDQSRTKEIARRHSEQQLFRIKEAEWPTVADASSRPFVGLSCASCTPTSRNSLLDKSLKNSNLINVLQVETLDNHPKGILPKIFPQIAQSVCFQHYPFPYIYDTVLRDERLQDIVREATRQALEDSKVSPDDTTYLTVLKRQQDRAVKILTGLRSTFSDFILRLGSWVMTKVMSRLFSSVVVHPAHIEMLKKASSSNLPLIFLPLHRSHFDYIVITYILCYNNIRSPLVAAGENLRIPVFGWLLRGLGAFFIKRRLDPVQGKKDIVYRAVLHTYMTECLRAGHNFEFFIEGGRTRSGKACMPKGGLLSVFVDAYIDGTIEDALLVPVSINYDRLVDGNFVREQMGVPKEMETFGSALKGIYNALTSHYGVMRVDFNQPFSLRELVKSFQTKMAVENSGGNNRQGNGKVLHSVPSSASLYGTDVVVEEQRQLVDCIARHIIHDCCRSTAIMSTNAVSFLLLNAYRDGVKLETLVEAMDSLRQELNSLGRDMGFTGDSVDVVNHALRILGPGLVRTERNPDGVTVKPVTMVPNVIELAYYSNCVLPHFILESVVATAIRSLIADGSKEVTVEQVVEQSQAICDILQFEFIFTKTCQNLEAAFYETIDNFTTIGILTTDEKFQNEATKSSQYDTLGFDEDHEDENFNKQPKYKVSDECERYKLYSKLLQPFLDAYTVTAANLHRFVSQVIPERDFVKEVLNDMTSQLNTGSICCGESLSVDVIRSSMKLFERWKVLECHTRDKIKVYYLSRSYDNETSVETVLHRIERFR